MLGGEEEEPLFSSSCRYIPEEELHHDRFLFLILYSGVVVPNPGSGAFFTPGSGIRDEQPGSYFLQLGNHFFGVKIYKILKFFDADPGSGRKTVRIRDPGWKKVGSEINIPDPQHCFIPVLWLRIRMDPH
jgi:hypothetical protein